MSGRTGEKVGWLAGWSGGFVWLLILAGIWLYQGQTGRGLAGLGLVAVAAACIIRCAPWKHPATPYRWLMVPIYVVFLLSVGFVAATGGFTGLRLTWWSLFWLLPLLAPLITVGRRTWRQ